MQYWLVEWKRLIEGAVVRRPEQALLWRVHIGETSRKPAKMRLHYVRWNYTEIQLFPKSELTSKESRARSKHTKSVASERTQSVVELCAISENEHSLSRQVLLS